MLVGREEILSCFAGIPPVLKIFHKLYLAIICKKFHPGKAGPLSCTIGIPHFPDKIFPCNCFSPPKRDEKLIGATNQQAEMINLT